MVGGGIGTAATAGLIVCARGIVRTGMVNRNRVPTPLYQRRLHIIQRFLSLCLPLLDCAEFYLLRLHHLKEERRAQRG